MGDTVPGEERTRLLSTSTYSIPDFAEESKPQYRISRGLCKG